MREATCGATSFFIFLPKKTFYVKHWFRDPRTGQLNADRKKRENADLADCEIKKYDIFPTELYVCDMRYAVLVRTGPAEKTSWSAHRTRHELRKFEMCRTDQERKAFL